MSDEPETKIKRPLHYGQVCGHLGEHADILAARDVDEHYHRMQQLIRRTHGQDEEIGI